MGAASCDLVFPGIADGPLFEKYRKTGKLSKTEFTSVYDEFLLYGKKFNGKACTGCTQAKAQEFSKMYDTVVLNEVPFWDVVRPYLPSDPIQTPKAMQLLSKLKLKSGTTIKHRKERDDGQPTERVLTSLIRTLQSGFEIAEKLKPLEKTIGEYETSLFDLELKEAVDGLSTEEISQKTQLEKDIADVGKKRDPLASKLKDCCKVLEERQLYIKGLMEMIKKYKTQKKFCRVELDGTVVEEAKMPKWFDIFYDPNSETTTQPEDVSGTATSNTAVPGATTKTGTISAPKKLNLPSNPFTNPAPKPIPVVASTTYPSRVQKWIDGGRKIKYFSYGGVLTDKIDRNERVMLILPLSTSDPKTAKHLGKGEEANKDAVERCILNGDIILMEEKDGAGKGTGSYFVRFSVRNL